MGPSPSVFDEQQLQALPGEVAIGHTRYSTTGANRWGERAAPHPPRAAVRSRLGTRNLVNVEELRAELQGTVWLGSGSDSR